MFMKNTALKNKNRRIFSGFLYSALFALTLIVYSACPQNVALGGSVDILPPNGEITYPDAGETPIRGSFVLEGTAKDDEGVQAVSKHRNERPNALFSGRTFRAGRLQYIVDCKHRQ